MVFLPVIAAMTSLLRMSSLALTDRSPEFSGDRLVVALSRGSPEFSGMGLLSFNRPSFRPDVSNRPGSSSIQMWMLPVMGISPERSV